MGPTSALDILRQLPGIQYFVWDPPLIFISAQLSWSLPFKFYVVASLWAGMAHP